MWDEQERFATVVSKIFMWLLAVFGVVLAAFSLETGKPDLFFGFLMVLGALGLITLVYGLAAVTAGGMLFAIAGGSTFLFRWLRNHFFNRQAGR
jgi:hypothetical protein